MTTSFLPRQHPGRSFDFQAMVQRTRSQLERHRDVLNLASALVLSGAFLSTLYLGCSLLLTGLIASAVAPALRDLGIGS